ncbi:hypothetical protein ACH4E7_23815 [Kitasatospora sp. NPDC018058]|uniref:hypothetical protein n=1 Tax=Kitasatospora sp. NPDC018058 TaxID=3364025 RepID=UPI0037C08BFF
MDTPGLGRGRKRTSRRAPRVATCSWTEASRRGHTSEVRVPAHHQSQRRTAHPYGRAEGAEQGVQAQVGVDRVGLGPQFGLTAQEVAVRRGALVTGPVCQGPGEAD